MCKCVLVIYALSWAILCWFNFSAAEYFTSSSHLRTLFRREMELGNELKTYIFETKLRLNKLKNFYEKVKHMDDIKTEKDISLYIGNPMKAYLIIRRLVKQWPNVRTWSDKVKNAGEGFSRLLTEFEHFFPTREDVSGAQDALLRLQETFSLSSNEIVEGLGNNAPFFSKLEVDDAYDIGKKAYYKSEHDRSASWLSEALRLLDLQRFSNEASVPSRFDVLDYLAWSEYVNQNIVSAYAYTKELLKLDPDNDRIKTNENVFKRDLEEQQISLGNVTQLHNQHIERQRKPRVKKGRRGFRKFYYTLEDETKDRYEEEKSIAQALCRGETTAVAKKNMKYLVCFYKTKHPLLVLKPAKVERIYPKPELILFRDAMSDQEIERVKELAHPLLQRATVHNPSTGKLEFADYRVSKSAWLDENDDNLVNIMNKRIEAYTGLDMTTAEKLQVANYGIGGHYETHFDFAREVPLRPPPWKHRLNYTMRVHTSSNEIIRNDGNRIATILFYMSNVERGGATVFTNIGQAVSPSKGDAVFWYNLHHDGSGDVNTRHAACPVLIGEKWVSNRWIHERGQEFRRKCRLKPEDDYKVDAIS